MYQKYLEPLIEEFTTGEYYSEVFRAKREFFEKTGTVYEDDPEFDQRMFTFLDWYLFERELPGIDLPPVKHYFRQRKDRLSPQELPIYRDFCSTVHSIFRFKRLTWDRKKFVLQDLFSRKVYRLSDPDLLKTLSRGDIFEARLVPFLGSYEVSKGFCLHPREMERFILSESKKVRHQDRSKQLKLMLQLSNMKLKHLRFQHIDVSFIYSFESRF